MHQQMTFSDIDLNPSVVSADEKRVEAQDKRMRRLFFARHKVGLFVSTLDIKDIGLQYNTRLSELRRKLIKHGLCIDKLRREELPEEIAKRSEKGIHYYHLVPLSKSRFYAQRKEILCLLT